MVNKEATRTKVNTVGSKRLISMPGGGHVGAWARRVKKAANIPEKNMNSEPSQMITPTPSREGRLL